MHTNINANKHVKLFNICLFKRVVNILVKSQNDEKHIPYIWPHSQDGDTAILYSFRVE